MSDAKIVDLIEAARQVQGKFRLRKDSLNAGSVGAALRSASGRVYTVCLDLACGIGFCAEHSAIAEMLKQRETQILSIVAVDSDGVVPPCGRCRELMAQLSRANAETAVVLDLDRVVPLRELLPRDWLGR